MKRRIRLFAGCLAFILLLSILCIRESANASDKYMRIYGNDRYKTAVSISKEGWPYGADYAIIARGDEFPDALCAGPLAKKYNGPILLTQSTELNADTLGELKRLNVKNIIVIGGESAISAKVVDSLSVAGFNNVERIWGNDRYDTSVKIAEKLTAGNKIALATGSNFPDALSISSVASILEMPILLTGKDNLPGTVSDYIKNKGIMTTYIVGGSSVVSDNIEKTVPGPIRFAGNNRFETNINVMEKFQNILDFKKIYLAVADGPSGDEFADALSGSVLAAKTSSPVVLVYNVLNPLTQTYVRSKMNEGSIIVALGGEKAVPQIIISMILGTLKPVYNITRDIYYNTIQDAVNNASAGDTIKIAAGIYKEHIVITRDNLKLIGEDRDRTIIDASQDGKTTKAGIKINYFSGIEIKNLTVENAGVNVTGEWGREPYGIYIYGSDKNLIDNVYFKNNGDYELYMYSGCDNNTVQNCIMDGSLQNENKAGSLDGIFSCGGEGAGSGISLMNYNNKFINNVIKNVVYGISLTAAGNTQILNNQIHALDSAVRSNSISAGIILSNSSTNIIQGNTIDSSQHGIRMSTLSSLSPYSYARAPEYNIIKENTFNTIQYGIRVMGNYNTVKDNTISGNSGEGIWLADSAKNTEISGNIMSGNKIAILADNAANEVHFNSITGSDVALLNTTGDRINAKYNWWGRVDPRDIIGTNISYSPWLGIGGDDSANPGFQPSKSMIWCVDDTIIDAYDVAGDGDIIRLMEGSYPLYQMLVINKNITITGTGKGSSVIKVDFDTSNTGTSGAAILVQPDIALNISNLDIDGSGSKIAEAIRVLGNAKVDNVDIRNISYQKYQGDGIAAWGNSSIYVTNSVFSGIEGSCISVYEDAAANIGNNDGSGGNTFIGSGSGEFAQHGVFVKKSPGKSKAVIKGNFIGSFIGSLNGKVWSSNGICIESGSAVLISNTVKNCNDGIVLKTGDEINGTVISPSNAENMGKSIESINSVDGTGLIKIFDVSDGRQLYPVVQ